MFFFLTQSNAPSSTHHPSYLFDLFLNFSKKIMANIYKLIAVPATTPKKTALTICSNGKTNTPDFT